jgi:hypothetical protein
MFFILTVPGGVFHTDSQWVFFILTETGGVFHTAPAKWYFFKLIESNDVLHTDGAKWWNSFWVTGNHNSDRDIYFVRLVATTWGIYSLDLSTGEETRMVIVTIYPLCVNFMHVDVTQRESQLCIFAWSGIRTHDIVCSGVQITWMLLDPTTVAHFIFI